MVAEREAVFIAAEKSAKTKSSDTTHIVKGTKKRRKVKQHPTPSPIHNSSPGLINNHQDV
jgi:hypothetical protein